MTVSADASLLVARARLLAEGGRPVAVDDMQHFPDLFPFTLDLAVQRLRTSPEVELSATAAGRVAIASIAAR